MKFWINTMPGTIAANFDGNIIANSKKKLARSEN